MAFTDLAALTTGSNQFDQIVIAAFPVSGAGYNMDFNKLVFNGVIVGVNAYIKPGN